MLTDHELGYYHAKISIGEEARRFLGERVGKYLLQKAQQDVDAVVDDFQSIDPTDTKAVIALQIRLKAALSVPQWLEEAVSEGANALNEYLERKELDKEEGG